MKLFIVKESTGICLWFILLHPVFFILILASSGSEFADGTVKTFFGESIMEVRDDNDVNSAMTSWKDNVSLSGGTKAFQKIFGYESGVLER